MKRTIIAIALLLSAATVVRADDPAPTQDQLAAAKQAFADGKALYTAGKLTEAVVKFKESYRLSRNPFLLYNIGHTLDQQGERGLALFYYRRFLEKAPANTPLRDEVTKRVEALDKDAVQATNPDDVVPPTEPAKPTIDFRHQVVDSAPAGTAYDVTAAMPEDAALTVTLFYRTSGEAKFTSKPMKWFNKELVGRIPAAKMFGNSIQYYLEVRDRAGALVTRAGKSTSPNVIYIEATAKPHVYPELPDEGAVYAPKPPAPVHPDGEQAVEGRLVSSAKWVSTGVAGALVGGTVVMYLLASKQVELLRIDSTSCGTPPCREFDAVYDQQVESRGTRYNTTYQVMLGVSVAAVAVAGYFWYRDVKVKQRTHAVAVVPSIDHQFAGAVAAVRF